MTDVDHQALFRTLSEIIDSQAWSRLGEVVDDAAVWEYPQSGETFRGLSNVRATFEAYPDLGTGSSQLQEVLGGTEYAITPNYTVVAVQGSGDRGTALIRATYPDGSRWWVVNVYELQAGKLARVRVFFAAEFEAPDWRAPYRDGPTGG